MIWSLLLLNCFKSNSVTCFWEIQDLNKSILREEKQSSKCYGLFKTLHKVNLLIEVNLTDRLWTYIPAKLSLAKDSF